MSERRDDDERARASEQALIARAQRGDRAAFNRLVELHQAGAYALALRMLGDPDTAADVTQDAFFSAYRAIASFRGTSFRAWLYRIVSNGCYDTFRAQSRRPSVSLEATLEDEREGEPAGQGSQHGDARLPAALIDATWDPERAALRAEVIEAHPVGAGAAGAGAAARAGAKRRSGPLVRRDRGGDGHLARHGEVAHRAGARPPARHPEPAGGTIRAGAAS